MTGARLSPLSTRVAMELRLSGQAHIVGRSVLGEVSELSVARVGEATGAVRTRVMLGQRGQLPDELPPDVLTDYPERHLADDILDEAPSAADHQAGTRSVPEAFDAFYEEDFLDDTLGPGSLRAGLVIVYAQWTLFMPTLELFQPGVDARYEMLMLEAAALTTSAYDAFEHSITLRRLNHALHDGHAWLRSPETVPSPFVGSLPFSVDHLEDGRPIVASAGVPELTPGDLIVQRDGSTWQELVAHYEEWVSAGSEANARYRVGQFLTVCPEATCALTVEHLDGTQSTVTLTADDTFANQLLPPSIVPVREAGPLDDLGAPDVFYVNLDNAVMTTVGQWHAALSSADDRPLVLDMRGYPGVNHTEFTRALTAEGFSSAPYFLPVWTGPDHFALEDVHYEMAASPARHSGPIAVIVGPGTQSAAEDFVMALLGTGEVDVLVGRTTSGADGNITGMALPGGFSTTFTGLEVLTHEGETFQGIGLAPDVEVHPTAEGLAAGDDEALLAAIEALAALE
jgi:hypothetical protein